MNQPSIFPPGTRSCVDLISNRGEVWFEEKTEENTENTKTWLRCRIIGTIERCENGFIALVEVLHCVQEIKTGLLHKLRSLFSSPVHEHSFNIPTVSGTLGDETAKMIGAKSEEKHLMWGDVTLENHPEFEQISRYGEFSLVTMASKAMEVTSPEGIEATAEVESTTNESVHETELAALQAQLDAMPSDAELEAQRIESDMKIALLKAELAEAIAYRQHIAALEAELATVDANQRRLEALLDEMATLHTAPDETMRKDVEQTGPAFQQRLNRLRDVEQTAITFLREPTLRGLNEESAFLVHVLALQLITGTIEKDVRTIVGHTFIETAKKSLDVSFLPCTRMMAAEILWYNGSLPENMEEKILALARACLQDERGKKDGITRMLARHIVCFLSEDWEELDQILCEARDDCNKVQYSLLAYPCIRHLPVDAVCDLTDEMIEIDRTYRIPPSNMASFYGRAIRRICEKVIEDLRTAAPTENFPAHRRYGNYCGRIGEALALIPKAKLEQSTMFYYFARMAYFRMNKETALKSIQLAKTFAAALPSSSKYDKWRKDIDLLLDQIENMEEGEEEGEGWKM